MKPGAFGKYAVDYEMRVDYERLRTQRLDNSCMPLMYTVKVPNRSSTIFSLPL